MVLLSEYTTSTSPGVSYCAIILGSNPPAGSNTPPLPPLQTGPSQSSESKL